MQNEKLYHSLSSLTKAILEIVSRTSQSDIRQTEKNKWVKIGEDFYGKRIIRSLSWRSIVARAQDEITSTQEFKDFKEVLNTDEVISPQLNALVGTYFCGWHLEDFDIACRPAHEFFLPDQGIAEFNVIKFDAVYSEIEHYLYTQEMEFENITPLCGFTMEDSKLSLTENISIEKLSEKEILEFFNIGIKLGISKKNHEEIVEEIHPYAIKESYKFHKNFSNVFLFLKELDKENYFSNKTEGAVIDALRIYKEGKFFPLATVKRSNGILSGTFALGPSYDVISEALAKNCMPRNQYKLLNCEFEEFKSFWKEKTKHSLLEKEKSFLSVAIRRFSQSNERDIVEDRIIDLMIAAEAIFLSSGGSFQGELKYRISHRASMFIETDAGRQRYLFDFMKKAYDVRSAIVHGSHPNLPNKMDGSTYTLYEFCDDIEKYLRISMKKAIDQTASAKDKSSAIDWDSIIFPTVQ